MFFSISPRISGFTQIFAIKGHILHDTSYIYLLVKKLKEKDKIMVPYATLK